MIELGLSTFGETTPIEGTYKSISHDERIRNLVEEIELADKVGLDIYAIGEHHRKDFAVSSPEIVLSAGAVNTEKIRLSSAVTVLSSTDPVRVYQNFSTVDAISNGRAEIMAGRGSFTESFPLFGYDLADYNSLFDEKLRMLVNINENEILTWKGKFTQTVEGKGVYPRAVQEKLPIWVATGGSSESTINIAVAGLPIVYAIIGGRYRHFKPLVETYKRVGKAYGHSEEKLKVGMHSWGYIDDTDEIAVEKYFYPVKVMVDSIAKDRPHWSEMTREQYLYSLGEEGSMFVGSPTSVANKIIRVMEDLQMDRFMLHLPVGSMSHSDVLKAIKLYGEQVAPKVREYFMGK